MKPLFIFCLLLASNSLYSQGIKIKNDPAKKTVVLGNEKLRLTLDYDNKVNISELLVNGQTVIKGNEGIYSGIRTSDDIYSTLLPSRKPIVTATNNTVTVTGITYGNHAFTMKETWTFLISAKNIQFRIDRVLSKTVLAQQLVFPVFTFDSMGVWEGAYQDYGGLAWFCLFNKKSDTYGVHSSASQFWNSKTGNGLDVKVTVPGKQVVMDYSRTVRNKLTWTVGFDDREMEFRYDTGTARRRYLRDHNDVWAPVTINAGKSTQTITLTYFDWNERYGRGKFAGINGEQVSAVLNTIARIGVIDKQHFGGNSWHTPYGPICLHEQYIAQMGLAINDNNYLKGYKDCLDFYRDNAIRADGRVWPRWAYTNEDMMPGQVTAKGFYEAQWGYLLDANPDFVTNVAELYDQNGDIAWVKTHQPSCEKALDWIIKRDSDSNGLVEMITDSYKQKRGSDWIDIIWASYENAFVNAKLYHALTLWTDIEQQSGNTAKAKFYRDFATKLKEHFNKPVSDGGFWDEENKCYIHWRDKDGSLHGRNMVTPVNFMAIAYGICTDSSRTAMILDNIETQMQKENLFFWPICLYSYAEGEGNAWQFPFPNYENGDIFLSWGAIAVKAYAGYKPELAIKYVKNVLTQYSKDGLAFQRYGRKKQDGLGDDILSGNSLSVVGLYQSIYGINPMYNRFYLNPKITEELSGTQLKYNYRNQRLTIDLALNKYSVSDDKFTISSGADFGFFSKGNTVLFFNKADTSASLSLQTDMKARVEITINEWSADKMSWTQASAKSNSGKTSYRVNNLKDASDYSISINGKAMEKVTTIAGSLVFTCPANIRQGEIVIAKISR
jgi:Bacterial alpha-L-rhamnosidase 6 hairpin glycosidase domain